MTRAPEQPASKTRVQPAIRGSFARFTSGAQALWGKAILSGAGRQVLVIAVASICYVHLAGAIGTRVLVPAVGWGAGAAAVETLDTADSAPGRFARWDSGYYLQIAQAGYSAGGTERAFFPLYPLAIRLLSDLSGLSLVWSGLLLSLACYTGACLFLYKWVRVDYPQDVAVWSVLWLGFFPMAFFFTALYAEPLFLLLSISSVYFARRGQFVASGAAIALAGATRPTAFLLAIPLLIEFWQRRDLTRQKVLRMVVGLGLAPMGALAYGLFLYRLDGNLNVLGSLAANESLEWHRFFTWPWISLLEGTIEAVFGTGGRADWFSRAIAWQDLAYALGGIASAIYGLFRLRPSIAFFTFLSMVLMYANHGPSGQAFWSVPRYVASLFPVYLILALVTKRLPNRFKWLLFLAFTCLLGIMSAWFASGRWVA